MAIPIITIPTENDILCGRGKGYDGCRANQIFRSTIADNAARYSGFQKNRTQKSILIHLIAHQLKMNNMRFVKRTNHGWKTLQEKEVNLKIGHALRDVGPLQQKSQKRACTRDSHEKRKVGIPREKKHTRVVSVGSNLIEDSLALGPDSGLPDQIDVDSFLHISLHHQPPQFNEMSSEQDTKLAMTAKNHHQNASLAEQNDFEILCGNTSNAARRFNSINDVEEPAILDVPLRDVYLDFVNDEGDDYVNFPPGEDYFEV